MNIANGMPYKGSKNNICKTLFKEFKKYKPNATIFIDLFGGGALCPVI